jgi:hypothetical protein
MENYTIMRWAGGSGSAVDIQEFETDEQCIEYLKLLDSQEVEDGAYHTAEVLDTIHGMTRTVVCS